MVHTTIATEVRSRGRPRQFDMEQALDGAVRTFREKGFRAASVGDLEKSMVLKAGSIYKAFKDKKDLFLAAFDRYADGREQLTRSALEGSTNGRDALRRLLMLYAQSSSGVEGRTGCLVVGSAVEMSGLDDELADRVRRAMARNESALVEILRRGQADGSIASDLDCAAAARTMLCVLQGMRVVGKLAKSQKEMAAVVDNAMKLAD